MKICSTNFGRTALASAALLLTCGAAMAATSADEETAAASYCTSTGGVSTIVHPFSNTNANPIQWVRYGGTTQMCTYTSTDGSSIQIFDSTLHSTKPTMAALAYYAQVPLGPTSGNPADAYCVQLGGVFNIGVPGTGSLWTTKAGVDQRRHVRVRRRLGDRHLGPHLPLGQHHPRHRSGDGAEVRQSVLIPAPRVQGLNPAACRRAASRSGTIRVLRTAQTMPDGSPTPLALALPTQRLLSVAESVWAGRNAVEGYLDELNRSSQIAARRIHHWEGRQGGAMGLSSVPLRPEPGSDGSDDPGVFMAESGAASASTCSASMSRRRPPPT